MSDEIARRVQELVENPPPEVVERMRQSMERNQHLRAGVHPREKSAEELAEEPPHLVCTRHGDRRVRMTEQKDNEMVLECPECDCTFQNIFRDPFVEVVSPRTGRAAMRNLLTGEETTCR